MMANTLARKTFGVVLGMRKAFRLQSSAATLVDVKLNEKHGYAVVAMQKPPVNSLNLDMILSLSQALVELETKKCKGLILTSTSPTVFSAGLDIREMYQSTDERLTKFWTALQNLWIQLYGSKMASVALINGNFHAFITTFCIFLLSVYTGHAPAGGCLLSMCCDYRVMVNGKARIGLNETQLGIVAPFWFKDTFVNTIGPRAAELALQLGTLFTVDEALRIGLVDQAAPDLDTASSIAETQLLQFLKIPALARYMSKMRVREEAIQKLVNNRESDTRLFVNFALSPQVQDGLGKYLASLAKKA